MIVSPDGEGSSLWVHQETWFEIASFDADKSFDYLLRKPANGVFAMVIDGDFLIGDQPLSSRDAMGIWNTDALSIKALTDNAHLLLIEVPIVEYGISGSV